MAWNTGTSYSGSTALTAALINGIGNDLRVWGGNVDAAGNALTNCLGVYGPTGANPLVFQANGLERLRITSAGYVGIATTGPFGALHVANGYIYVTENIGAAGTTLSGSFNSGIAIGWNRSGGAGEVNLIAANAGSSGGFQFTLFNPSGGGTYTNLACILGNGNFGIGTTAPTSPLQVTSLPTYASDAAAGTGGLTAGAFYKDSGGGLHVKL